MVIFVLVINYCGSSKVRFSKRGKKDRSFNFHFTGTRTANGSKVKLLFGNVLTIHSW